MILWNRKEQTRFIEAVERLVSLVNDLDVILRTPKKRRAAAIKANATRAEIPSAALVIGDQVVAAVNGSAKGGDEHA